MRKKTRFFAAIGISLLIIACNIPTFFSPGAATNPFTATPETIQPSSTVTETTTPTEETVTPSPTVDQAQTSGQPAQIVDFCTLVTTAEIEAILAEPATPPVKSSGGCMYNNAKDKLYALTLGAGQGKDAIGFMQGQAILLGFAGAPLDEARMGKLKELANVLDYTGFFSELVASSEGSPIIKAKITEGGDNDLVYWAWITAQPRVQGAYVAVRGSTLVNINLVVADTRTEEEMLAASESLANEIFNRLPTNFSLGPVEEQPPSATSSSPQEPDLSATPTRVPTNPSDPNATATLAK